VSDIGPPFIARFCGRIFNLYAFYGVPAGVMNALTGHFDGPPWPSENAATVTDHKRVPTTTIGSRTKAIGIFNPIVSGPLDLSTEILCIAQYFGWDDRERI
jgi:hypothetical protein